MQADNMKRKYLPTPPNSDEDGSGTTVMSIDAYFAGKDKFRRCPYGKLPVFYPFRNYCLSSEHPLNKIVEEFGAQCQEVLNNFQIGSVLDSLRFYILVPLEGQSVVTLMIWTLDAPQDTTGWIHAATEVEKIIHKQALARGISSEFSVEIRNMDEMYQDTSSSLIPNSPAHKACIDVEKEVCAKIQIMLRDDVSSIGFAMRGPKTELANRIPTLMVSVKPGSEQYWGNFEKEIEDIFEEKELVQKYGVRLRIEIIPATTRRLLAGKESQTTSQAKVQEAIPNTKLRENPNMGSSIGPHHEDFPENTGTLGLWVQFKPKNSDEILYCFLTCFHVAVPGEEPSRGQTKIDKEGYFQLQSSGTADISVDYPSAWDGDVTLQSLEEVEKDHGHLTAAELLSRKICEKYQKKGNAFGRLLAGSGTARKNKAGRRMDWALIQVRKENFGANKLPHRDTLTADMLASSSQKILTFRYETGDKIGDYAAPNGNDENSAKVFKLGRTTGLTGGNISCMSCKTRWLDDEWSNEISVQSRTADFALPGDSGAAVFNLKKEWVGMVIARDYHHFIISSAIDIMDDIETMTGGTVYPVGA